MSVLTPHGLFETPWARSMRTHTHGERHASLRYGAIAVNPRTFASAGMGSAHADFRFYQKA